jgi:hypothetical protein
MEDAGQRALRLAKHTADDILADLTEVQLEGIRRRVRQGREEIKAGRFTEYEGREGLKMLAEEVKAVGRGSPKYTHLLLSPAAGKSTGANLVE